MTDSLHSLRLKWSALSLFRGVLDDEIGWRLRDVLEYLADGDDAAAPVALEAIDAYASAASLLQAEASQASSHLTGDLWQEHLLNRLLLDTNLISAAAERGTGAPLSPALRTKARAELRALQGIFQLSLDGWQQALAQAAPEHAESLAGVWTSWEDVGMAAGEAEAERAKAPLRKEFAQSDDWAALLDLLVQHYRENGAGLFGQYRAFRWVSHSGEGVLEGIPHPDATRVDDLIGYEAEKAPVLRNTRFFVNGAPGNNVLLYGDAGTGKSSMVKALLNTFGDEGLRLIEVPKELLGDFPYITRLVAGRSERFILFVDDLSFEENETEYKALKAALEGSLEARPDNVLVYATSNRRHLIREYFGDRPTPGRDEIHPSDTSQEKISLADRFGLRVGFRTTSQAHYFEIVYGLAERAGLSVSKAELRRMALEWAQHQNGFSGRTATQFVNDLQGAATSGELTNTTAERV